jgi:hypothetical protein
LLLPISSVINVIIINHHFNLYCPIVQEESYNKGKK